jgi:hypothetical protein
MMLDKKRVKKVKLVINPATTPSGRFFPPVRVPDNTTGRMGRMQGERIVTTPPMNANKRRRIITPYYTYIKNIYL